jgi:hypothetical protein
VQQRVILGLASVQALVIVKIELLVYTNNSIIKTMEFEAEFPEGLQKVKIGKGKIFKKGEWLIILYYLESVLCGVKASA